MQRCAIYARFSTDKQSPTSAEDQIATCQSRAAQQGWEVAGIYTDAAISGASNRRPGMTAMLADAAAGSFDIICAEALDRLARDQEDIAGIYKRVVFAGARIHTLTEGDVNELHIGLKGTMSALFLKDLADKIRRGQRGTLGRGRVPGGRAYGYDVVHVLGKDGEPERGLRTINEEQAHVVRRIYREFVNGRSPKAIAHDLNRDLIPSPGGGEWRASTINGSRARGLGILHNPIYAGRYLYNRVRMVRDPESRRRVSRVNSADERVEVEMPELRIIPPELWAQAQAESDRRSTGPMVQQRRAKHLLSGLLFCGECGGAYAVVTTGRVGCTRHREAGTCSNASRMNREELEQRVLAGLADQLLAPDAISLLVKEYHREVERRQADRRADRRRIERQLATANRALDNLVEAIATGAADFREIREAMVARRADRDELVRAIEEHDAEAVIALNPAIVEQYRERIKDLAARLQMGGASVNVVANRVRDLIERVNLTPSNGRGCNVEVVSSLGSVVALATDKKRQPGRSNRMIKMVAEEGLEPPTRGL